MDVFIAEAAVLDNATSLVALLGYLTSKVREVRRFRQECQDLTNACITLSLAFLENSRELTDVRSKAEFANCLRDVYLLVMECREWGVIHATWEVVVRHKFRSLKARFDEIQKTFGMELLIRHKESSSQAANALRELRTQLSDVKGTLKDGFDDRKILLDGIQRLQIDARDVRKEVLSLRPMVQPGLDVIHLPDPRVKVTEASAESKPLRGIFDSSPVSFEEILDSSKVSAGLPRIVKLYREMSDVAQIQRLYGIAQSQGSLSAIMEDMGKHQSLEAAILQGTLSGLDRIQKLRIAYETAATVSALHESGILVKVISDTTVYLENHLDGRIRPKIAELSHARRIWETSNRDPQDARFDAPETYPAGSRSKMSDVWSLGIVLLQTFTGEFPFKARADIHNEEEQTRIRALLQRGERPFALNFGLDSHREFAIVMDCLNTDPFMRPTASWLSEQLFELVIRVAVQRDESAQVSLQGRSLSDTIKLDELAQQIRHVASKRIKGNAAQSQPRLTQAELKPLIDAAQGLNPKYAFVLGLAYMRDLVQASEEDNLDGPTAYQARCAQRAIPYLEKAEQHGHIGAIKELARAHKALAEHYYAALKMEPDD